MYTNAVRLRSRREEFCRTLIAPAFWFPRSKFRDTLALQKEWSLVCADALLQSWAPLLLWWKRESLGQKLARLALGAAEPNQAKACFHSASIKTSYLKFNNQPNASKHFVPTGADRRRSARLMRSILHFIKNENMIFLQTHLLAGEILLFRPQTFPLVS